MLQGRNLGEDENIDDVADQLTSEYWPDNDDYSAVICRMQVTPTAIAHTIEVLHMPPLHSSTDLQATTTPVRLPDCRTMAIPRTTLRTPTVSPVANPTTVSDQPQLCITQGISRLDNRRHLADTGASVCTTGMRKILHDFTSQSYYAIVGYDGASTQAAGQGTAYIRDPTTGALDKMFFVYVPSIVGTIVSLEHHARTHPLIH